MSNLLNRLTESLSRTSRACIHYGDAWYSSGTLRKDIETVVHLLDDSRLRRGDRVLLGYPNSYAFVVVYFAILQSGAIAVPFNPDLKKNELAMFLIRTKARFGFFHKNLEVMLREICTGGVSSNDVATSITLESAFITDRLELGVPEMAWTAHSDILSQVTVGDGHCGDSPSTAETFAIDDHTPSDQISDEDAAVLMYTSGTTGRPKAVVLRHRHLLATASQIIESHQLTSDDVSYCFLPLFHINAQVVAVLSTLLSGGRIVIAPRFSASRFWASICEHQVTWVSAVPTVIAILQNVDGPEETPASLRFVRSASAQLPQLVARRFERRFGVPIIQSYGMTEAASQICVNPLPPGERRSDSVGLPMGVELRIVDEDDCDVSVGTVGEVLLRGSSVIERYEEADNQNDFRGGWFHTGDMGRVDADGYVYLTGRKKELINRAGEKVSPYEVEDVIREHPAVEQVAVIGLPDPMYGEEVAAYVVVRESTQALEGLTVEILTLCQESLSRYKWPSKIQVVSQLPVGPTGKIQRTSLKKKVLSAMIS
ncbi:AMP-binding protein [Alicyclobacillus ferrooxydans]|uniref:AMP-dependent synthetase n=1 Tax=Alicyclobacillus ferrooxydans TaxID=471514 RepID=A0A0P9EKT6_9BACL|nr:AMP-binding protein [Alicyclobacillus ferrooxydans]KPV43790.1 hypothetical protein AN477_10425 [Alicyclobacillus ferrooxydans]